MLEFIVGAIIGIWAAQQFTLPSVQQAIHNWWSKPEIIAPITEEEDSAETFSGPMPSI